MTTARGEGYLIWSDIAAEHNNPVIEGRRTHTKGRTSIFAHLAQAGRPRTALVGAVELAPW